MSHDARACLVARAVYESIHPAEVIVFGSRARGDFRPDSDVDLLVLTSQALSNDAYGQATRAAFRAADKLYTPPVNVEVVHMSLAQFHYARRAPNHVAGQAAHDGVTMSGESPGFPPTESPDPWPDIEQRLKTTWRNLGDLQASVAGGHQSQELMGFLAQQAVENALKAWISALGARYRNIHDIGELIAIIRKYSDEMETDAEDTLAWLTAYAVKYRYTGAQVQMDDPQTLCTQVADLCQRVGNRIQTLTGRTVRPDA